MLSLKGGKLLSEAVISHAKGTEIVVKNLFFNTPARLQNLQSANVELSYTIDYVSKIALANPNISFVLTNNNKEYLRTSGNGNLLEVISEIYSNTVAKDMLEIFDDNGLFKIHGYISNINQTRSSKSSITIIINHRIVHSNNIINAIIAGYDNLLMKGRYPIAVLDISVDLGMVDVNVHPSKYEVRLSDEENLKTLIQNTISRSLNGKDLTVETYFESEEVFEDESNEKEEIDNDANLIDFADNIDREDLDIDEEIDNNISDEEEIFSNEDIQEEDILIYEDAQEEKIEVNENVKYENLQMDFANETIDVLNNDKISKFYYIGQLFGTYILAQDGDNFYMIDQHAANERINYEKIKREISKDMQITYDLLVPFTLSFSPADAVLVKEKMAEINKLGIVLDEFGADTFVARRIPIWIFRGREKEFIEEIITKIIQNKGKEKIDFLDDLSKSLACKKSIKANEYHTVLEIEFLLEELAKTSNPYTCPHGRPVTIKLSKEEIEKMFKRIV